MDDKIRVMKDMIEIQGQSGNWDCDEYMHGMYNGMEFMLSIAEDRQPKFRNAPKRWKFLHARIGRLISPAINIIENIINKFKSDKSIAYETK